MTKKKFIIMTRNFSDDEMPWETVYVNGYVDNQNKIGYYKDEREWISTDLDTGLRIISGRTRKECEEKTMKRFDELLKIREDDRYETLVKRFNEAPIIINVKTV